MVRYIGNGSYCYADSMAMALDSLGIDEFDPSFIEVATTVGFGALLMRQGDDTQFFFSHHRMNPDTGMNFAFDSLGYRVLTWHADPTDPDDEWNWKEAQARLGDGLRNGAVILGPLDMGYLRYNPFSAHAGGVDHFVLVYGQDERGVMLHDPAGFPYAHLSYADLRQAWRADRISYKRGSYTMRSDITPGRIFARGIIYRTTLHQIARNLSESAAPKWVGVDELLINDAALRRLADLFRTQKPDGLRESLSQFGFALAARRQDDTVRFLRAATKALKESAEHLTVAADTREAQARLLGAMQVAATGAEWDALADLLTRYADQEVTFTTTIQTIVRELPTQLPS